jgi:hypothetical protein
MTKKTENPEKTKPTNEAATPSSSSTATSPEDREKATRESFSGRMLNNRLHADFVAVTKIIERGIHENGTFVDQLGDYSYAIARSQRFDAAKAETTLRDLFRERNGQTMNQLREQLVKREESLTPAEKSRGLTFASEIASIIEVGDKLTFNRVLAAQAERYGDELGITHAKARGLMAEAFEATEGRSIYDWGKELDQRFFQAQVDAEKAERSTFIENDRSGEQAPKNGRGHTRSGPSM